MPASAGYAGSVLVPKLLAAGYGVTVLDLYLYDDVFDGVRGDPDLRDNLREIKGHLRDPAVVASALEGPCAHAGSCF